MIRSLRIFRRGTLRRALDAIAGNKSIDDYDLPQWLKDDIQNRRPFTAREINDGFARVMEKRRRDAQP